jgi:hypothetical protein
MQALKPCLRKRLWRSGWALFLGVSLALGPTLPAVAQADYRSSIKVYNDNRQTTVLEAALQWVRPLGHQTDLRVRYKADAISSASVSCSTCHRGGRNWNRNEIALGLSRPLGETQLGLDFIASREMDYASDAVAVAAEKGYNRDNTKVSLGYTYSWERPRPHGWDRWSRKKKFVPDSGIYGDFVFAADQILPRQVDDARVQTATLGLTQILTPRTVAQVNLEYARFSGHQQNPYHLIPTGDTDLFERHPSLRQRRAAALRLKHALSDRTSMGGRLRYYNDDWGVRSGSASIEAGRYWWDGRLFLQTRWRYYRQTAADFYQSNYNGSETYLSNDDRLQAYSTHYLGIELGLPPLQLPWLQLKTNLELARYTGGSTVSARTSGGRDINGGAADLSAHILRLDLRAEF